LGAGAKRESRVRVFSEQRRESVEPLRLFQVPGELLMVIHGDEETFREGPKGSKATADRGFSPTALHVAPLRGARQSQPPVSSRRSGSSSTLGERMTNLFAIPLRTALSGAKELRVNSTCRVRGQGSSACADASLVIGFLLRTWMGQLQRTTDGLDAAPLLNFGR
jgi:hypothetical protein